MTLDSMALLNDVAERRMRNRGSGSSVQEATFLQRADPSGVEVVDQVIHVSGPWDYSTWGNGTGTVDPFGAGVGYVNPYPPEREPPSPEECETECECYPHDGDNGPGWECEMEDFDDQSDESTETGSIKEGTCYNERGLTVKCKENGDVAAFKEVETGNLFVGVYDANNKGHRVYGTFVPVVENFCQNGICPDAFTDVLTVSGTDTSRWQDDDDDMPKPLPNPPPPPPTWEQVVEGFMDCVRKYWGNFVKINSATASNNKGVNGRINVTYLDGEATVHTNTIINDATSLDAQQIEYLGDAYEKKKWGTFPPAGLAGGITFPNGPRK